MPPQVDLVIIFSSATISFNKAQVKQNAQQAEEQYARLLSLLQNAGLQVVGKRGEKHGELLILVKCPPSKLHWLAKRERESDFIHGLAVPNLNAISSEADLTPANRVRLVHSYITLTAADGGLEVVPGSKEWSRVTSIMALHDPEFNDAWIRSWTNLGMGSVDLDRIKDQFGEAVGLYFCFLTTYMKSLTFVAALGVLFHFFGTSYSPLYSFLLLLWSTSFVEYWRVCERKIAVRWGTRGAFRVEKHRHEFDEKDLSDVWWKNELKRFSRIAASVPVILVFVLLLAAILTGLFVFEAFVTQLYHGPGQQYISLAPTVLFMAAVPNFMAFYQSYAVKLTNWENHKHHSTHDASLTLKRFALSAIVAYLGLCLSAFVYVPFGPQVMAFVHILVYGEQQFSATAKGQVEPDVWQHELADAKTKLNSSRLQNQMYAYTVTNQIIGLFLEIGLPFIMRGIASLRKGKGKNGGAKGKRVGFEDEPNGKSPLMNGGGTTKEEREFLMRVRKEVALGHEYNVFEDYSEMVTQFGYVAIWSGLWTLAPMMALINNWMELRSDAFKITVHARRPIPIRVESIGPWLECLTTLIWVSAVINSALVYLFSPSAPITDDTATLMLYSVLAALAASHGFIVVRGAIAHVVDRVFWRGSREQIDSESVDKQVKDVCLNTLKGGELQEKEHDVVEEKTPLNEFWQFDEGLEEIQKVLKEA